LSEHPARRSADARLQPAAAPRDAPAARCASSGGRAESHADMQRRVAYAIEIRSEIVACAGCACMKRASPDSRNRLNNFHAKSGLMRSAINKSNSDVGDKSASRDEYDALRKR
jgi:hypothetical protein